MGAKDEALARKTPGAKLTSRAETRRQQDEARANQDRKKREQDRQIRELKERELKSADYARKNTAAKERDRSICCIQYFATFSLFIPLIIIIVLLLKLFNVIA